MSLVLIVVASIFIGLHASRRQAARKKEADSQPPGPAAKAPVPGPRAQQPNDRSEEEVRVDGFPRGLRIRHRRPMGAVALVTGDDELDSFVAVQGGEDFCRAFLDAETRESLRALFRSAVVRQAEVEDTLLQLQLFRGEPRPVELLAKMTALGARARSVAAALDAELMKNLRTDPLPGVRRRCLDLLLARDGAPAQRQQALAAALVDGSGETRLFAAQQVSRDESRPALEALVLAKSESNALRSRALSELSAITPSPSPVLQTLLLDRTDSPALRLSAFHELSLRTTSPSVLVLRELRYWLEQGEETLQRAALGPIVQARDVDSLGAVQRLTGSKDAEVAAQATRALAILAGSDAEPRLLELLHHEQRTVRNAAMEGLAESGTLRAVDELAAVDDRRSRSRVAEAQRRIQARAKS